MHIWASNGGISPFALRIRAAAVANVPQGLSARGGEGQVDHGGFGPADQA